MNLVRCDWCDKDAEPPVLGWISMTVGMDIVLSPGNVILQRQQEEGRIVLGTPKRTLDLCSPECALAYLQKGLEQ